MTKRIYGPGFQVFDGCEGPADPFWKLVSSSEIDGFSSVFILVLIIVKWPVRSPRLEKWKVVSTWKDHCRDHEKAILKAMHVVEEAILDVYCATLSKSLGIADLGCSSGPNTLLVVSKIIDTIDRKCHSMRLSPPEFRVFLNDLIGNDFNTVFMSLPAFYKKRREEKGEECGSCFMAGVPGSFYGRIFPSKSLHFLHSSYALQWLSQVPPGLTSKVGEPLNKGTIYISNKSPPCVWEAYLEQFQKDFLLFLKSRSEEMVDEGRMVLTFPGRISEDPTLKESGYILVVLGEALSDMVAKGLIKEEKLDSFNFPNYFPSVKELEAVIQKEGSFTIDRIEIFKTNMDVRDDDNSEFNVDNRELMVNTYRAAFESILTMHFGEHIISGVFKRQGEILVEHLSKENTKFTNILLSMKKKA